MNRLLRCSVLVLCAGLISSLPAAAQGGPPPAGGPGGAARAPYVPKNLKVLPANTDINKVMRGFTGDLGVGCNFCHAADRAADTNPTKDVARYMIQMTNDLNDKYIANMPGRQFADPITCGTCHRGESHPSVFTPAPRPQGGPPAGGPPAGPPPA
jgi:hypothetical protein